MFQLKEPRRCGLLDSTHTSDMVLASRVEVIGDKGILFINRCTARSRWTSRPSCASATDKPATSASNVFAGTRVV
jgi:hypothetical protein